MFDAPALTCLFQTLFFWQTHCLRHPQVILNFLVGNERQAYKYRDGAEVAAVVITLVLVWIAGCSLFNLLWYVAQIRTRWHWHWILGSVGLTWIEMEINYFLLTRPWASAWSLELKAMLLFNAAVGLIGVYTTFWLDAYRDERQRLALLAGIPTTHYNIARAFSYMNIGTIMNISTSEELLYKVESIERFIQEKHDQALLKTWMPTWDQLPDISLRGSLILRPPPQPQTSQKSPRTRSASNPVQ